MDPVKALEQPPQYQAISDYAIIGDCGSVALIARNGGLDWLCLPRVDSPSMFAAILDSVRGGTFRISPRDGYTVARHYVNDTNVLETTYTTATGIVRLIDFMPVDTDERKQTQLWPRRRVVRLLECVAGEVEIEVLYTPRPSYARVKPRLQDRGALGIFCTHREEVLVLRSEIPLELLRDRSGAQGRETLHAGDRRALAMNYDQGPALIPVPERGWHSLARTLEWWQAWAGYCRYEGPFRREVLRSALALKLLTYAPSGAIVAAPTTSLPERIGSVRNWDYRYSWLRDASMTLSALVDLGYSVEGQAYLSWLLHPDRLDQNKLQVLYTVHGDWTVSEWELRRLAGYRGSRPVRVGNAAHQQLQLDTYGELIFSAVEYIRRGGKLDQSQIGMLSRLSEAICQLGMEPDDGIWESRGGRRMHTFSKVMCTEALDWLLELQEKLHMELDVGACQQMRDRLRHEIETRGYNAKLGSYVTEFDGNQVDASLFLLDSYGYLPSDHPRIRSTYAYLRKTLCKNDLCLRYTASYHDGLPPGEGYFGICSFWDVASQARQGDLESALQGFGQLLKFANDVGLFAEEIGEQGEALGNFPQAFTHVGVIDTALTIADLTGQYKQGHAEQHTDRSGVRSRA